jgi:hypothetical protein
VYAFLGTADRAFNESRRELARDGAPKTQFSLVWAPAFAALRKTEQFKTLLRHAKLPDYWRARGWPDLCHPVGADDFECR